MLSNLATTLHLVNKISSHEVNALVWDSAGISVPVNVLRCYMLTPGVLVLDS